MRSLFSIARKDALVLVRDKAAVLVLIGMPLALIFILGSALGNLQSGDFAIKVAIVNEDTGEMGEHFVEGLTGEEGLQDLFDMRIAEDAEAVRADVESGNLAAALIIPADMSEKVAAGESANVEVLQDPGSEIAAGVWAGVVRAAVSYASAELVIGRTVQEQLMNRPKSPTPEDSAPPAEVAPPTAGEAAGLTAVTIRQVKADTEKAIPMMSYYAAGMTAMFLLFGSMFGAFSFVTERRQQTLARMLVAPTTKTAIVGGKGLGIFFIGVGQLVVLVLGTSVLFRVDWGADLAAIFVLGLALVFASTGLAMTLAALGKTERTIGAIAPAIIMLFAATGGSMFPAESMPAWIRPAQVISPSYWALGGFLEVIQGAVVADVLWRAGIIVIIGIVLYAFGIWRLRYE